MEPPWQNVVGPLGLIVGVGLGLTVTTVPPPATVPEQPLASVTVTEYVPDTLTLMATVVAPGPHRYLEAADDVRVTEPPWQNVVGPPGVIVGVGLRSAERSVGQEGSVRGQPLASVTVTEYVPEALTVIDWVGAPVHHK